MPVPPGFQQIFQDPMFNTPAWSPLTPTLGPTRSPFQGLPPLGSLPPLPDPASGGDGGGGGLLDTIGSALGGVNPLNVLTIGSALDQLFNDGQITSSVYGGIRNLLGLSDPSTGGTAIAGGGAGGTFTPTPGDPGASSGELGLPPTPPGATNLLPTGGSGLPGFDTTGLDAIERLPGADATGIDTFSGAAGNPHLGGGAAADLLGLGGIPQGFSSLGSALGSGVFPGSGGFIGAETAFGTGGGFAGTAGGLAGAAALGIPLAVGLTLGSFFTDDESVGPNFADRYTFGGSHVSGGADNIAGIGTVDLRNMTRSTMESLLPQISEAAGLPSGMNMVGSLGFAPGPLFADATGMSGSGWFVAEGDSHRGFNSLGDAMKYQLSRSVQKNGVADANLQAAFDIIDAYDFEPINYQTRQIAQWYNPRSEIYTQRQAETQALIDAERGVISPTNMSGMDALNFGGGSVF